MSYIDSFQDTVPSPLSPLSPPLLIELSWTDEQGGLAEGNEEVVSPPPQPSCLTPPSSPPPPPPSTVDRNILVGNGLSV